MYRNCGDINYVCRNPRITLCELWVKYKGFNTKRKENRIVTPYTNYYPVQKIKATKLT